MHELSNCQALLDQVEAISRGHSGRVDRIRVSIGPLSGVDAGQLERAFGVASAATALEGTELAISATAIRVRCRDCDAETTASANRLLCGHCGSWRTRLASGDELLLLGIDLTEDTPAQASAA